MKINQEILKQAAHHPISLQDGELFSAFEKPQSSIHHIARDPDATAALFLLKSLQPWSQQIADDLQAPSLLKRITALMQTAFDWVNQPALLASFAALSTVIILTTAIQNEPLTAQENDQLYSATFETHSAASLAETPLFSGNFEPKQSAQQKQSTLFSGDFEA